MKSLMRYELKKGLNIGYIATVFIYIVAVSILYIGVLFNDNFLMEYLRLFENIGNAMFTLPVYVCIFICCISIYKDLNTIEGKLTFSTPNSLFKIMASKVLSALVLMQSFIIVDSIHYIAVGLSGNLYSVKNDEMVTLNAIEVIVNSFKNYIGKNFSMVSYVILITSVFLFSVIITKKLNWSKNNMATILIVFFTTLLTANYINVFLYVKEGMHVYNKFLVIFWYVFYISMRSFSGFFNITLGIIFFSSSIFIYDKLKDGSKIINKIILIMLIIVGVSIFDYSTIWIKGESFIKSTSQTINENYTMLASGKEDSIGFEVLGLTTITKENLDLLEVYFDKVMNTENLKLKSINIVENNKINVNIWQNDSDQVNSLKDAFKSIEETVFQEVEAGMKKGDVILSGMDISEVKLIPSNNNIDRYNILLELDKNATKGFGEETQRLVGRQIGIFIGEELISSPTLNAPIIDGKLVVSTGDKFSKDEIAKIANRIKISTAPFDLKILD
ncbi:UNVERIFIED_CONTAM: hypothetical protein Cloal_3438 [Acetivibrio alkalicellulosi]